MATQEQRRQATRSNLVEAARTLFRKNGIEGVTTRAILEAAKVSRGAMYHHFASLEELIEAVYECEAKESIERALKSYELTGSPIEDLIGRCLAWLDELADPEVARVTVIEGPAAIGWERCRNIEAKHSLALMVSGLDAAEKAGEIEMESTELTARILNAILAEIAFSIVRAADKQRSRTEAEMTFRQLLQGLRSS
ncbi:TetR/AcrR family transcriptional regulator [Pseudomaricurvus alkylphenolicus]|uniref:TetR/AcrR family transcriptional regulator n=1 Tax=Pseudomaricurvus alkylphenolicus TaxID=1306991 RepID=UPI0014229EB4|nr:TetR/AcrR family transcriptional regulator [Pseudomaricurvus alkylphenolicus]NIB39838.1 TetR/AcrR family transcriptional regulator [Pseudomaricurvus alkylphenolicus]